MILLDRLFVNLQHSYLVTECGSSLLLEKHSVIQLGCFVTDLIYSGLLTPLSSNLGAIQLT